MLTLNTLLILTLITVGSNTLVIYSNTQTLRKVNKDV